jgi:hypothetical protein
MTLNDSINKNTNRNKAPNTQINPTGDNAGLVLAMLVAPAGYFFR